MWIPTETPILEATFVALAPDAELIASTPDVGGLGIFDHGSDTDVLRARRDVLRHDDRRRYSKDHATYWGWRQERHRVESTLIDVAYQACGDYQANAS